MNCRNKKRNSRNELNAYVPSSPPKPKARRLLRVQEPVPAEDIQDEQHAHDHEKEHKNHGAENSENSRKRTTNLASKAIETALEEGEIRRQSIDMPVSGSAIRSQALLYSYHGLFGGAGSDLSLTLICSPLSSPLLTSSLLPLLTSGLGRWRGRNGSTATTAATTATTTTTAAATASTTKIFRHDLDIGRYDAMMAKEQINKQAARIMSLSGVGTSGQSMHTTIRPTRYAATTIARGTPPASSIRRRGSGEYRCRRFDNETEQSQNNRAHYALRSSHTTARRRAIAPSIARRTNNQRPPGPPLVDCCPARSSADDTHQLVGRLLSILSRNYGDRRKANGTF